MKKAEDVRAWNLRAGRGDTIVYHRGLLMRDRLNFPAVEKTAAAAWSLSEVGAVALLQRRLGEGDCQYIAVKR